MAETLTGPANVQLPSIAILGTRGIPARYGGFETFAEQLATRLAAKGYPVTVYAESRQRQPDLWYQGVRVRHIVRPGGGGWATLAYDLFCLWDARARHDILYMLGYGAAWACWLPRRYGTQVWINIDGLEWARPKWSWPVRGYLRMMEWLTARVADVVVADAEALAERYRRLYPHRAPCHAIAYGAELVDPGSLDDSVLKRLGLQPDQYGLVIARPEPENHLLDIVVGYQQSGVEFPLVIVGAVDGATAYQRRLRRQADGRVRFLGPIYDKAVLDVLRARAAVYLHGHSVGGTNPSLLEAMACGALIVAHDNPFNREVLGQSGWYFSSPTDLSRLLQAVWHKQLSIQADTAMLRQRARDAIRERYTWERIVQAYEALLRQVPAQRPGHPSARTP